MFLLLLNHICTQMWNDWMNIVGFNIMLLTQAYPKNLKTYIDSVYII